VAIEKTLPRILTLGLFVVVLLGTAAGVYLKAKGTLTWGQFAGWEATGLAFIAIIGVMVLHDRKKS